MNASAAQTEADTSSATRTYVAMPGYGKQTADAGRAFWRARRDMSRTICDYRGGSLLASNFNQLWCGALNTVQRGERLDYFAMLHDDVGAEDFWLDKLIDELEIHNLDVLAVVTPIKDTRGLTSTALHREGDNWRPYARLSMHEVFELPETFTSDDVGRPLLLNTGCWVCRWNQDWARLVHFEINDRIVFNRATSRYQAQTEPEDWHFSRQLHEIGAPGSPSQDMPRLRIGATRKVRLIHRGEIDFTNAQPWGAYSFDSEALTESPLKTLTDVPLEV